MLPAVNFAHAHFISSIFFQHLRQHPGSLCAALVPRGLPKGTSLLLAGTSTGEILIYDTLSGVLRLNLFWAHRWSYGLWLFSPDGSLLASSSDDS